MMHETGDLFADIATLAISAGLPLAVYGMAADPDATQFARWLGSLLEERDWKIARFARELGVSRSSASRWVNGHGVPSPELCQAIAALFEVQVVQVLRMAGHINATPTPPPLTPGQAVRRDWLLRFRDLVVELPNGREDDVAPIIQVLLDVLEQRIRNLR